MSLKNILVSAMLVYFGVNSAVGASLNVTSGLNTTDSSNSTLPSTNQTLVNHTVTNNTGAHVQGIFIHLLKLNKTDKSISPFNSTIEDSLPEHKTRAIDVILKNFSGDVKQAFIAEDATEFFNETKSAKNSSITTSSEPQDGDVDALKLVRAASVTNDTVNSTSEIPLEDAGNFNASSLHEEDTASDVDKRSAEVKVTATSNNSSSSSALGMTNRTMAGKNGTNDTSSSSVLGMTASTMAGKNVTLENKEQMVRNASSAAKTEDDKVADLPELCILTDVQSTCSSTSETSSAENCEKNECVKTDAKVPPS